jgi:large subunit ribosomal protein L11
MEFCKAFNAATGDLERRAPSTVITVYADQLLVFETISADPS